MKGDKGVEAGERGGGRERGRGNGTKVRKMKGGKGKEN